MKVICFEALFKVILGKFFFYKIMSAFLLDKVKNLQPTEAVSVESPNISSPFNESVMKTLIFMVE